ncbi:acetylornithine deacetylase [Pararhizobium mangrovi]|uniref:Acetylornithine deacetylase n=1 Tax=Pararhizobium mangrovi TaxID=2590452 RepID=A0A506U768_9HYPH|nr:acetylornithine deacetylase [Pararhizobium mangrovi]TPW30213.1 acetylornithine deacetylase [Pararhizobium mangrovi]
MTADADFSQRLAELVAFPTVSSASNLALVAHVEAIAAAHGARCRRFLDADGEKANLVVTIGPEALGGLVLSGHTDVVPVTGQTWSGDPWTLRTTNEHLVARGATDMKGFLACSLAVLPHFAQMELKRPIHLAFSYDEEVGCTGVGPMAEWLGTHAEPSLAVIGEATGMDLVTAHKGGTIGWTSVTGKPAHSSQPDNGVNAVMIACDLVGEINRIAEEMRAGPAMAGIDPPFSTIQVNQIEGGSHGNILAEHCRFFFEMRLVPDDSAERVLDRIEARIDALEPGMKAVSDKTGIRVDIQARIPPLAPIGDAALEERLLKLLGRSSPRAVPYGTEAGIFSAAGIPSVVIGPGSIADAHQPDESIAIEQMAACTDFLVRLAASEAT